MKTVEQFRKQLRLETPAAFLHKHVGVDGRILKANQKSGLHANITAAIDSLLPEMLLEYNKTHTEITTVPPPTSFFEDLQNDPRVLAGTHVVEADRSKCGGKGQVQVSWVVVPTV
jgi:hypothetical protein